MSKKEELHKKYLEHDLCNGIPYDVYQYVFYIENENNKLKNFIQDIDYSLSSGRVLNCNIAKNILKECE